MGMVIVEGEGAVLGLNLGHAIVPNWDFARWLFPNYFGQYLFLVSGYGYHILKNKVCCVRIMLEVWKKCIKWRLYTNDVADFAINCTLMAGICPNNNSMKFNLVSVTVLSERMQWESRDLENPSTVHVTVITWQVTVWLEHRLVQVCHSLSIHWHSFNVNKQTKLLSYMRTLIQVFYLKKWSKSVQDKWLKNRVGCVTKKTPFGTLRRNSWDDFPNFCKCIPWPLACVSASG